MIGGGVAGGVLYRGVAEWIVDRVAVGAFKVGDRVPSIRALASQLGVSLNTVREGYALLERRRYLECRPQSGYFVRMAPPSEPAAAPFRPELMDPRSVVFCKVYGSLLERGGSGAESLAIAVPDPALLPSEPLRACLAEAGRRMGERALDYSMTPGPRELREAIALCSVDAGARLDPDGIVVSNGCSEAVFLALMATCAAGDTVAIESPIYFNFIQAIGSLGLKVLEIPSSPREGMSLEALRFALAHHRVSACLSIPTFSNPSGSVMPAERKRELVRLLDEADVPLIEDDVHGDLHFSGPRPPACKSFDESGNVLYCSSFSKTLGPGFRVGWIAPGKRYDRVERIKTLMNVGGASITQNAVAAFLRRGGYERRVRSLRSALAARVRDMRALVAESFPEGTRSSDPAGGFLLWIELPEGCDAERLYAASSKEGIIFPPGPLFSASGGFARCLRLNSSASGPAVEKAVRRLGELAEKTRIS